MANQSGQWHRKLPAALVYAVVCGGAMPAQAQTAAAGQDDAAAEGQQLPEVIVSAQRVASPASKTPVAMTVLRGAALEDAGIGHPAAIGARVPGVSIDGAADGLKITIRGVSNNDTTEKGDPSAAFMQDGIYIARPQSQGQLFFDIARVEVLRGPQGTLYGRNTTAGVVNVISNQPGKRFEGAVSAEAGNYASRKGTAMLNVPVSEALALRGALAYNKHDPYLVNGQGTGYTLGLERDDVAARLSAKLALGRGAALLLRADRSTQRDNSDSIVPADNFYATGADGSPVWTAGSTRARLTNAFVPPNAPLQQGVNRAVASGLGAELDWDLGPLTLHYLGAQRSFDHDHSGNYYYWVAPVSLALGVRESFTGRYRQDSHELRLATAGAGPLTAQAGLYYFRERADVRYQFRDLELLGLTPYYVFPMAARATGKALFGQATYALGERVRATLGARYSDDGKARTGSTSFQQAAAFNPATDFALPNIASLDTHKATWRAGAEFDLAPGTLLFGTVSTGYKAGGFNDGCLAGSSHDGVACPAAVAVPANALVYQPETLTSYEAGVKSRFWGGRASLNATVFHYDYANLQLSGVVIANGAPLFMTTNAAQASVRGLEIEGELKAAAGRLRYSLALLDAHYASYLPDGQASWAGKKLDRAPATSATLGYEHDWRLGAARLKTGLFTRYSSGYVISVPSQLRQYPVPSHTESDLALDYAPDGAAWSLHATVRNLEDKVRPVAVDSFRMLVPSAPRTAALRFDLRF